MTRISRTKALVYDALLMALYVLLAKLTIPIGAFRITLASLPLTFSALFLTPYDSFTIGVLGEFICQVTSSYGLTPTTPLWIIVPGFRAICLSLPEHFFRKKETHLEKHLIAYFLFLFLSSIMTTALNTAVWFLDCYLLEIPYPYTAVTTLIRALFTLLTTIVVGILCLPLLKVMRKKFEE